MRKKINNNAANKSIEKIINNHRHTSYVLHEDSDSPKNLRTANERLRLLLDYSRISDDYGYTLEEALNKTNSAWNWYVKFGFPGLLGKNFRDDDHIRTDEINVPIADSAQKLNVLLRILSLWQNSDFETLRGMITEVEPQKQSKSRDLSTTAHSKLWQLNCLRVAWSAQANGEFRAAFGPLGIEPYQLPKATRLTNLEISALTRDQLEKSANIMLHGIQPTVQTDQYGQLTLRYSATCDWHIIATAFTELLLNKERTKLRLCRACDTDISSLRKDAFLCRRCSAKKSKVENMRLPGQEASD